MVVFGDQSFRKLTAGNKLISYLDPSLSVTNGQLDGTYPKLF